MFCMGKQKLTLEKCIEMASVSEVDQVAAPSTDQLRFSNLSEHKYKRYYMCSLQSLTLCLVCFK